MEVEGLGGKWESEGDRDTERGSWEQVRYLCPYLCFILFLLFYFSASQVSSASSPPPPVQTGTGLLLNAFSWASLAPNIVGVAAVNNTAGMLFGRSHGPRHRAATRATSHGCRMDSADACRG